MPSISADQISRYHFLTDTHPLDFIVLEGKLGFEDVAVLFWADAENEQLRPMAILLNDKQIERLKIEGGEITKTEKG